MHEAAEPAPQERRLRPPTLRVALLIGAAIVLGTVLYLGRDALGPFILGLFLVYLLDPAVSILERRVRLPRWLAVLVMYVAIVVGFIVVIRVTLPPLIDQISLLIQRFPELAAGWISGIERVIADLDLLPVAVREQLIAALQSFSDSLTGGTSGGTSPIFQDILDWLLRLDLATPVANLLSTIFAYLVIPIFVFYLLKDRPSLVAATHAAMPAEWRPDIQSLTTIADRVFARWLRGQLLLGLVVGIATFIGLEAIALIGIAPVYSDFAILLAIIAGVLELVPIIGPIISAIPIVLVGATAGLEGALAGLILAFAVQQVENNFLVPKIQSDATDLHPAIVIAGIIIGGSIGGILGAILALPVTAAFRDVIRYLFRRLDTVPMPVDLALAEALRPADWRGPGKRAGPPPADEAAPAAETAATEPEAALEPTVDDREPGDGTASHAPDSAPEA